MRKILTIIFVSALFSINNLVAQEVTHIPGQLIVKLSGNGAQERLQTDLAVVNNQPTQLKWEEKISRIMNIWLFTFDDKNIDEKEMLRLVKQHPNVLEAQFNHTIKQREVTPNDPLFKNQWQWKNTGTGGGVAGADVDAEKAWDITTGGLTITGDTIVVCVVDDGTAFNHPDLKKNLFKNWLDIPGDGMDNDGNGYVDDFDGWNINNNTDNVGNGSHGVNVAGMIGAVGNNGEGVTGINWNIKIMTVRYGSLNEVEVIKAYDYPYIMRKIYNESDGKRGAFVVATNSSWGIDDADPIEYPLWCSYYDSLGAIGILSCAATTNTTQNVDVTLDMPTACLSDYMVAVGRTNNADQSSGGFGVKHIDLGAPGDAIYTTSAMAYTTTTGTSFASPLVAGILALMYSVPCTEFMQIAKSNPGLSALLMKQYLLAGVDKVTGFDTKYLSGGRANAFQAIQKMLEKCSACQPPNNISIVAFTDTTLNLNWIKNDTSNYTRIEYRLAGEPNYTVIDSLTSSSYIINSLTSCTEYEIRIASWCGDTLSNYSKIYTIKTLGCCEVPKNFTAIVVSDTSILVSWNPLYGALGYQVLYKSETDPNYTVVQTNADSIIISPLQSCSDYNIILLTTCPDSNAIADSLNIKSAGCDICDTNIPYCESKGEEFGEEWISNFTINDLSNDSGADGYFFFNTITTVLDPGETYPISITPAYTSPLFEDNFKVWIDYNQDGDFDDANELVWDPGASSVKIQSNITVPLDAEPGNTRLRVIMYYDLFGATGNPCDAFPFGETEDYCIHISETCYQPIGQDTISVGATSATVTWNHPTKAALDYTVRYRLAAQGSPSNFIYNITAPPVTITSLEPNTTYRWYVKSNCTEDSSDYTDQMFFTTDDLVSTTSLDQNNEFKVAPNPFNNELNLSWTNAINAPENVEIIDPIGKVIRSYKPGAGDVNLLLTDLNSLPGGMYVLLVKTKGNLYYKKLVKN